MAWTIAEPEGAEKDFGGYLNFEFQVRTVRDASANLFAMRWLYEAVRCLSIQAYSFPQRNESGRRWRSLVRASCALQLFDQPLLGALALFVRVHGGVGRLLQGFLGGAILGIDGQAHAGGGLQAIAFNF